MMDLLEDPPPSSVGWLQATSILSKINETNGLAKPSSSAFLLLFFDPQMQAFFAL